MTIKAKVHNYAKYIKYVLPTVLLAPMQVGAAATITSIIGKFRGWIESLLPIFITVAMLYFIWGVIKVIRAEGDKRDEAKKGMWSGIIALFVIISIWGIVAAIASSLDVSTGGTIVPPQFKL